MPAPQGALAGDLFLLVRSRMVTVGGPLADLDKISGLTAQENPVRSVERLQVVETATVKNLNGQLILSTDSPPFPGITAPGTLTLLKPSAPLTFLAGEVRRDSVTGAPVIGAVVQTLEETSATAAFSVLTDSEGKFVVLDPAAGGPHPDGALIDSRLDVADPVYKRVIRRDVRATVGPPAPKATMIAYLDEPFVLPMVLPQIFIDILGDIEPPQVQITLDGVSYSNGFSRVGDPLSVSVTAIDNDEVCICRS